MSIPAGTFIHSRDLRSMGLSDLKRHFGATSSGRLVMARLMRALVLQVHQAIQAGREAPILGNLRSFFYRFVTPILAKIPPRQRPKKDPYDTMSEAFTELVMTLGWISYADFDFTDENWAHRFVGQSHPDVLVFAEKRGWIRFLRRCHQDFGTSALALGGMPSALTSEYTAKALEGVWSLEKPLRLLGVVDWDPSGRIIAHAFQDQLRAFGVTHSSLELLVDPSLYTQAQLSSLAYPITNQPTKTRKWLQETGGIQGQARGLASESAPWDQLLGLVQRALPAL